MHAVIFDIDDTLLHSMADDDRLYRAAIREVVGDVEFRASLADYEHVTDAGILQQVLRDNELDAGFFNEIRERFLDSIEKHVAANGPFQEIDGAREMLGRLQDLDDHLVAFATGCWRRSAELKLRTAGFAVDGLPLASADDAIDRIGIMRHALGSLDGKPASVIYYGDGVWDQRACRELGWRFRAVGPALNGLTSFRDEFRT